LDFRAGSWPGKLHFQTKEKTVSLDNNKTYWTAAFNSYFFTPSGCLFCNDYFCDKADIAFGDPWMKSYPHETDGDTVIIVRSQRGEEFLTKAIDKNVLNIREISPGEICLGHINGIYNKRTAIHFRLKFFQFFQIPVPKINEKEIIRTNPIGFFLEFFYILNNYFIRKIGLYDLILKMPGWLMFIYRFSHAILMKYYLEIIKFKDKAFLKIT